MSIIVETKDHGTYTVERAVSMRAWGTELELKDAEGHQVAFFADGSWVYAAIAEEVKD